MSNRKKPRNRKMVNPSGLQKIDIPGDEKVVIHEAPATLDWSQVEGVDRDDVETVGKTFFYDDGTFDAIIMEDISEEAKKMLYGVFGSVDNLSVGGHAQVVMDGDNLILVDEAAGFGNDSKDQA